MKVYASILLYFICTWAYAQDYSNELVLLKCIEFDGTESVQEESKDLIFRWSFGDGSPDGFGPLVEHCYDSIGDFDIFLSVIEPETKIIFMEEHELMVSIEPDLVLSLSTRNTGDNKVYFEPKLEGEVTYSNPLFFWDFGDGGFDVGENPLHQFDQKKSTYDVRLLVKLLVEDQEYQLSKTITIAL